MVEASRTARQRNSWLYSDQEFQGRHEVAGMVVVADAGMLSASILRELDEANLQCLSSALG